MGLKVVEQFPGHHKAAINKLLVMGMLLLGAEENLVYIVNGSLDLLHLALFCVLHHQDNDDRVEVYIWIA